MAFISSDVNYVTATSYVSIARMDIFTVGQSDVSEWQNKSIAGKEAILMQSSLAIDSAFSYANYKTDADQVLKFPRNGAETIPASVDHAIMTLALKYARDEAFKGLVSEKGGKFSNVFKKTESGLTEDVTAFLNHLRRKTIKLL